MSASREKKQRQSAGPDQKALRARQEQAARKRRTIVYSVVGALSAVLVAALLIWRTGFFQARASAAALGGETLSTAQLSYYYHTVRNDYLNSYYSSLLGFDNTKADDEQVYAEGQTYRDYFMAEALKNAQSCFALEREAVNAGHTEAEVKDDLDAAISSVKSSASSYGVSYSAYLRALYGSYMNAGVFERELTRSLMASLVANEKYDELYDGYGQGDLDDYYAEHKDDLDTIEYSYLYFAAASVDTKDADGNELPEDEVQKLKDDAKAEAKKKAEEALEAVKGGSSFQIQADKYELTSSGDHTKVVGTGSVSSAYSEQLLKLGKDQCELVETDSGCYVISFHDRYLADEPTRDVRHILIRAEHTTGENNVLTPPTDEAWAAAKAKMDEVQAAWDASGKTEDDFAKLANEKSNDAGSNTTGGLYKRRYNGYFVPEFNDWLFDGSRRPGDVGMVQHSAEEGATSGYYGYHLIYYVGESEPVWKGTVRDTLAKEAETAWEDGLSADYPTSQLGGAGYLGK